MIVARVHELSYRVPDDRQHARPRNPFAKTAVGAWVIAVLLLLLQLGVFEFKERVEYRWPRVARVENRTRGPLLLSAAAAWAFGVVSGVIGVVRPGNRRLALLSLAVSARTVPVVLWIWIAFYAPLGG